VVVGVLVCLEVTQLTDLCLVESLGGLDLRIIVLDDLEGQSKRVGFGGLAAHGGQVDLEIDLLREPFDLQLWLFCEDHHFDLFLCVDEQHFVLF